MTPRELSQIVNDSRRIRLMEDYIARHGGYFDWNQHTGWTYVEEAVISNKVAKAEKREEQRAEEKAKKKGLFSRKPKTDETE